MTKQEITDKAKEYADRYMKLANYELAKKAYLAGAEMVNEKQLYTREDMKKFFLWLRPKLVEDDGVNFLLWGYEESMIFEDLLKLWEESKNG